jgi:hypothetical protein
MPGGITQGTQCDVYCPVQSSAQEVLPKDGSEIQCSGSESIQGTMHDLSRSAQCCHLDDNIPHSNRTCISNGLWTCCTKCPSRKGLYSGRSYYRAFEAKKKKSVYMCPIPNGFRGTAISMYRRTSRCTHEQDAMSCLTRAANSRIFEKKYL